MFFILFLRESFFNITDFISLLNRAFYYFRNPFLSKRLYDIVKCPDLKSLEHLFLKCCNEYNDRLLSISTYHPCGIHSVNPRHLYIQKKYICLESGSQDTPCISKHFDLHIFRYFPDRLLDQFPYFLIIITDCQLHITSFLWAYYIYIIGYFRRTNDHRYVNRSFFAVKCKTGRLCALPHSIPDMLCQITILVPQYAFLPVPVSFPKSHPVSSPFGMLSV